MNEDIEAAVLANTDFRRELATGRFGQLVLMSIPAGESIGRETHHDVDQVLVFVEGEGEAELDGEVTPVTRGRLVFVPAGTEHDFRNTGSSELKLYTFYAPPEHAAGTVHRTRAEADAAEHH
jgi:mannose-6-phosphate isomerase-like protein (cupin superfamily)